MSTQSRAQHKLCRRIGECIWDSPKCPSKKRPYAAGLAGKNRRSKKLSTYGELLLEKQKLKAHYAISEKQLRIAYAKSKKGTGMAHEKLFKTLETRLDAFVFRSGLTPTIFAAKQAVSHGHVLVNNKKVNISSYRLKQDDVVSINTEVSPTIAETAKNTNLNVPSYIEVDRENCKATLTRVPEIEEIPVKCNIMSVIEFYAR
jgi:small subunit ribosomal protein S4